MNLKALKILTVTSALALAAAACGSGSPAQPSSVIAGSTGTSFAAAHPVSPLDRATVSFASQPVVMAIANGAATSASPVTYTFEVATDSAFATKVYTKDGVAAESGTVTHQSIAATLPGATTYYWHARTNAGGSSGPFSATVSFVLGPQVSLQTPVPSFPAQNGVTSSTGASLSVVNVGRSGPAGVINYRFDVADSSSFSHLVFSGTQAEQSGGTTGITVNVRLSSGVTYFWRVTATDPVSGVSSVSPAQTFTVTSFNVATINMVSSPSAFPTWDQTAKITSVEFSDDAFQVDFDRRDGPNRWPDLQFAPGSDGTLQYTLGMCLEIPRQSGSWYCSAVVQFWYGRELTASTPPSYVGQNWFYDSKRWGPMAGDQPQDGETVALFVGTGNLRNQLSNDCPQVCERSNFQLVTWQNYGDKLYEFATAFRHILGR